MVQLTVTKNNQVVFKGSLKSRREAIQKINSLNDFYNGNCQSVIMTRKN